MNTKLRWPKNPHAASLAVLLLEIAVVGGLVWVYHNAYCPHPQIGTGISITAPAPGSSSSGPAARRPSVGLATESAYQQALNQYADGYRFQFVDCHGTPGTITLKDHTTFMLDNRDSMTHRFSVAGQTYAVGAYSFAFAKVPQPGTYFVTCDGGGAAQVVAEN